MKKRLVLLLFVVGISGFLYYRSRAIPDLDETRLVTTLPVDVQNVLGANVGLYSPQVQIRVPMFLYHYVENVYNDPGRQKLNIPPNVLISQIETLKEAGYVFITPNDLADALSGKIILPQKIIMLSFDDGYMDFYTDVFPILKKEQVKAVTYIIPNFLDRPNYMFTFQLQEVAKSPFVEIGAHTMNHLWLKGTSKQTAEYEIVESRKTLEDLLHLPINSFAYPYGAFDLQTIQIVKDAGFSNAVSTVPGIEQSESNVYFIYRLRPGYRSGQALLDYLEQDTFQPW